ncbi:MAG TPA: LPS assembly lipoprotein LptE [Devosia sp.]|nr:LPS assembly lipoprotein LptE [Devosia sp.]
MSSLRLMRAIIVTATLALALSACTTLRPVYGENGLTTEAIALAYAEPASRLEQIIYQELALRLGKATGDAPELQVTTSQASKALTAGGIAFPNRQRQMIVTARIRLVAAGGKVLFSGSRSAAADYTTNVSQLANQQAETDAAERAAKALAETIRLTLIAALASPAQ